MEERFSRIAFIQLEIRRVADHAGPLLLQKLPLIEPALILKMKNILTLSFLLNI
jgi:hypothetical protein